MLFVCSSYIGIPIIGFDFPPIISPITVCEPFTTAYPHKFKIESFSCSDKNPISICIQSIFFSNASEIEYFFPSLSNTESIVDSFLACEIILFSFFISF